MRRIRHLAALGLLVFVAGTALPSLARAENVPNPDPSLIALWEPCEPGVGVTVIVDRNGRLGDGKIYVRCAPGPQPNGVAALQNAGFQIEGTLQYGLAFICRIDGEPTPAEETCQQTPGASSFWGYFVGRPGGRWGASGVGAANPLSAAPIDSVQGWGFGGIRIEPMNGAGPSAFALPPAQESSTRPATLARKWLTGALVRTAELELQPGSGVNHGTEETLLETLALNRAGVSPAQLEKVSDTLDGRSQAGAYEYSSLQSWTNSSGSGFGIDPNDPEFPLYGDAGRYALAIMSIAALGGDPTSFAGVDFRSELIAKIDEASGKILNKSLGGAITKSAAELGPVILALATTGPLPAKALPGLDLLLAAQEDGPTASVWTMRALIAARENLGLSGLGPSRFAAIQADLEGDGEYLESLQEVDGGIRAGSQPTFASTASGAVGLALTGHREAARKAAKWVSRYQVTAEYAGGPDPVTAEPAPAEGLIGGFFPTRDALRNALAYGIPGEGLHGTYDEAQLPTAQALEALTTAGPYGPRYAVFDQESLWFDSQTVGSLSNLQAATLTNEDPRALEIGEVGLVGAGQGAFRLDAGDCAGRTLYDGESCELSARFAPTSIGLQEAIVQVALDGSDEAFDLSLGGTGVSPVSVGDGGLDVFPRPQGAQSAPVSSGKASVLPVARKQAVGKDGVARIATLSCPAGSTCVFSRPARVRVTIGRETYWAKVLAPHVLADGRSASLRVRLSKSALRALGARSTTVVVPVTISSAGTRQTVRVKAKLVGPAVSRRGT